MSSETRNCQNCKSEFIIEPDDFVFYEKMRVPPPTFCPDCRLQRRMSWRNERTFYKGKCSATGKDFLTMFSPESKMTVYDRDYWWSDNWDQLETGRDYDFNKPFFVQFAELLKEAPLPNLANSNCINSQWGNHSLDCKNCYLFHASLGCENSAYITGAVYTKDSFDVYKVLKAEHCYETILSGSISKLFFSFNSDENVNSAFLFECRNMQDSFACVNMRNGSRCIFNRRYAKDEYVAERAKYDLGSYRQLETLRLRFREFTARYPRRFATVLKSVNVVGDHIINSKNSKYCFDGFGEIEDSKYIYHGATLKDSYDGYGAGATAELMYEVVDTGAQARHCMFNVFTHGCQEASYTYACHGSSYLFGCMGLRGKQYCILNKQYTKESFDKLRTKIKKHMQEMPYVDNKGRVYKFGEFFPTELSPFAYNETIAQEYFPLTKEQALGKGYSWRDPEQRRYEVTKKTEDLPDHIKDVPDSIIKEIIECAHQGKCNEQCTTAFKVIESELQFLRKMNLPLPRLCPNCRHYQRLKQRNPLKLWHRKCMCSGITSDVGRPTSNIYQNTAKHFHGNDHCPNEFETPYAPERLEMVYCEQCYNAEVV